MSYSTNIITIDGVSYRSTGGVREDGQMAALETEAISWEVQYPSVFGKPGVLGKAKMATLSIDTGDAPSLKTQVYHTPVRKRVVINNVNDEMLELGVIRPSTYPWSSGVILAPKKHRSTRFCVGYR